MYVRVCMWSLYNKLLTIINCILQKICIYVHTYTYMIMNFYFKLYYRLRSSNNADEGDDTDEDELDVELGVDVADNFVVGCFCGKCTYDSVVVVVVGVVGFVIVAANEGGRDDDVDGINADEAVLLLLTCCAYSL